MADFEGTDILCSNSQSYPLHPFDLAPDDVFPARSSFGFSPGTSPAPGYIKPESLDSLFDSPNPFPELNRPAVVESNEFHHSLMSRKRQCHSRPSYAVQQPSRLVIPAATNREKYGQLTPPSETTPTKESMAGNERDVCLKSIETPTISGGTRRRRSDLNSFETKSSSASSKDSPRRRKSRKQSSNESATAESDEKRNQFLERNRIAASKCRRKKKEWTANLEQRARELQASKTSLGMLVTSLREELLYLKGEALKHTTCDCNNIREYLARPGATSFSCSHVENAHSSPSASSPSFVGPTSCAIHNTPPASSLADAPDLPDLGLLGDMPD